MNRFFYRIDRMLSQGQGRQILWMVLVVSILVLLFWGISAACGFSFSISQIIQLILAPGEFVLSEHPHIVFQIVVNLFGLVLVSSMLISILSNIVENRASAYSRGLLRYRFHDHVLFLGADEMLVDTIVGQCSEGKYPVVVLTEQDAEEVRKRLMAQIQDSFLRERLVVLYGHRTQREQLLSVHAQNAQRVFILGEPDEQDHDSKNILSLSLIKDLVQDGPRTIECYFLCNHLNTLRILQLQTEPLPKQLHLTVMNAPESWAQRVLVNGEGFPPLNRHEHPGPDDQEYVHLVLLGASQMAYEMAFTTAHVAHYPNFITQGLRTRITIIDEQMDLHSEFLRSHYASLFRLARRKEIHWKANDQMVHEKIVNDFIPAPDYDFLDIEWQFISARSDSPEVRELLEQWIKDPAQMLTVAVCIDDMRTSLATALYLPDSLMTRQIPILVYQSTNSALAQWTKTFTRYTNIYPFGMREDCYDKTFRQRLEWAKAANEAYEDNAARLNPQRKRKHWFDLKLTLQFSNLYSANYCHSVLTKIDPQYYARLEHQRWLTERLLLGYKAMDKAERIRIEQLPEAEKWKEMDRLEPYFEHPNIQPFDELTPESVHKDDVMVNSMLKE